MPHAVLLSLLLFAFFPQTERPPAVEPTGDTIAEDYRLGPGDVIAIRVFGSDRFDQVLNISNSGKIHLRHLGVLKIDGMSVAQLEVAIREALIEKDLLKDPWIKVTIEQYRSQPVYILGEVMLPGQYIIKKDMYVSDLIVLSAGFNDVASPVGYLYRRRSTASEENEPAADNAEEAIPIVFKELYEGQRPELNLRLQGGDVLYVPQRRMRPFFVVGDVASPGVYELPPVEDILVSEAISKAGGPTKTAKMSKGVLVRYDESGAHKEFAVDFKGILEGRKPDMVVRPNDIVFIPGSAAKELGYSFLGLVPRVASDAVTGNGTR